jgi:hypothetical protein
MRAAIRQQVNSSSLRNHLEQVLDTELGLLQQRVLHLIENLFARYANSVMPGTGSLLAREMPSFCMRK